MEKLVRRFHLAKRPILLHLARKKVFYHAKILKIQKLLVLYFKTSENCHNLKSKTSIIIRLLLTTVQCEECSLRKCSFEERNNFLMNHERKHFEICSIEFANYTFSAESG